MTCITVKYYIETPENMEKVADIVAKMQSVGTWKEVKKEQEEKIKKHAARVKKIEKIGEKQNYELPTRYEKGKVVNCGYIEIDYNTENFENKISMLLTTVAGEIFDMEELTAVKLIDIEFNSEYLKGFHGPKFGIEGTRNIINIKDRPLFGAIIKPCVGLSPSDIGELAYEVGRAGVDFIKDDELLANPSYNSIKDRVKAVSKSLDKVYEETGKIVMYAFNITDDPDEVIYLHDIVKENGGRAIMFNVLSGGFSVLNKLSKHTELPIHCHRDFAVSTFRSQYLGISSTLFSKLVRLSGGDQVQIGGLGGYIYATDDEILENVKVLTEDFFNIKKSLPVISGGMWAGKLPFNLKKIKNEDFLFLCGGGVFSHPDGGYGGVKSLFAAYEAYKNGIKLEEFDDEYLKRAIEHFGEVMY